MKKFAVVGAGISGLSHAYYLRKQIPDSEVDIFEFSHWGGVISTRRHKEVIFEAGPEAYLMRTPLLLQLTKELQLENELIRASKESATRYIVKEGRLVKLPTGPLGFLFNSVLFFPEKIKVLLAFRKKFNLWQNMSVFDAVKSMSTMTAAEYFASAFCRGVFGSEAEDLEFAAILPELYSAIRKEDSLAKAMKKVAHEKKAYWEKELGENAYHGFEKGLVSFRGGLETLTTKLKDFLKEDHLSHIRQSKVSSLHKSGSKYLLHSKGQKYGSYDAVFLAIPAKQAAEILRNENKETATLLQKMQYSPITVVVCGWDKKNFSAKGFGFISPRKENLPILGTQFVSNIFAGRAPENQFVTKTMIAGDNTLFSDDELAERVLSAHKRLYKISAGPLWYEVIHYKQGLPRYFLGYTEWKQNVLEKLNQFSGRQNLFLCGWNYDGIGLPHALEKAYSRVKEFATTWKEDSK